MQKCAYMYNNYACTCILSFNALLAQVSMVSVPAQVQPLAVSSQQPVTAFSPGVVAAPAPTSSGTEPRASSTPMVPATVTAGERVRIQLCGKLCTLHAL